MIIHGVTPTDDVSVVSVQQVLSRLGLKRYATLSRFLSGTMKYIAYHEPRDEEDDFDDLKSNKFGVYNSEHKCITTLRLLMPLSTAWRLIHDFEAGKILKQAERL